MVSQCNAGRDESFDVDFDMAQEDAQTIYDVGALTQLVVCRASL